jgi:hypothetical protein
MVVPLNCSIREFLNWVFEEFSPASCLELDGDGDQWFQGLHNGFLVLNIFMNVRVIPLSSFQSRHTRTRRVKLRGYQRGKFEQIC